MHPEGNQSDRQERRPTDPPPTRESLGSAPSPHHSGQQPSGPQQSHAPTDFTIVFRGFDREEVQRHLDERDRKARALVGQRDAARGRVDDLARRLEAAKKQHDEMRAQIDRFSRAPIEAHGLSERMEHMLALANEEAADIVAQAERKASDLRGEYERKISELDAERTRQREEHDSVLAEAMKEANQHSEQAREKREQADVEAERRRRKADADAEEENRKRKDASAEEADRLVQEAKADAARRISEATAEVDRLRELLGKISTQLGGVLGQIERSAPLLRSLPEEREAGGEEPDSAVGQRAAAESADDSVPGRDGTRRMSPVPKPEE
jgi:chromosome segregation ATPase